MEIFGIINATDPLICSVVCPWTLILCFSRLAVFLELPENSWISALSNDQVFNKMEYSASPLYFLGPVIDLLSWPTNGTYSSHCSMGLVYNFCQKDLPRALTNHFMTVTLKYLPSFVANRWQNETFTRCTLGRRREMLCMWRRGRF